jgi:hypothetical protein
MKMIFMAAGMIGWTLAGASGIAFARSPVQVQARDYPWCAVRQGAGQFADCHYVSLQQCRASVTVSESCIRNARMEYRRVR